NTLPWLISFSVGGMKVLVFGNFDSGKSTYARALAAREGLAHPDLDSIVWEPGKIALQCPRESVAVSLQNFIDSQAAWVIEGSYRELVRAAPLIAPCWFSSNRGRSMPGKQSQAVLGAVEVRFARASKRHAYPASRVGGWVREDAWSYRV